MAELGIIQTRYTGGGLVCPFCMEQIPILVDVDIEQASVRRVGSEGFNEPKFTVDLTPSISRVRIEHDCRGPKK